MGSVWKSALCCALGGGSFMSALWIAYARWGTDEFFMQHWRCAEPVMMSRTRRWALWQRSLRGDERDCLRAWLDAMSLAPPSAARFAPLFVLQDTMCFICGYKEWCNAVRLLAMSGVIHTTPYCTEIRRERQGNVVFLHGKLETDVALRIPFTSLEYRMAFPSVVSLQLEETRHRFSRHYNIAAAEHRWFCGPLASQQSASLRSPWGDVADLLRRLTGFTMSCLMTAGDKANSRFCLPE